MTWSLGCHQVPDEQVPSTLISHLSLSNLQRVFLSFRLLSMVSIRNNSLESLLSVSFDSLGICLNNLGNFQFYHLLSQMFPLSTFQLGLKVSYGAKRTYVGLYHHHEKPLSFEMVFHAEHHPSNLRSLYYSDSFFH